MTECVYIKENKQQPKKKSKNNQWKDRRITPEDNERLRNDSDEIVSNNVDHHNEMLENSNHWRNYYS